MAKLSARNRTEIARFKTTFNYVRSLDGETVTVTEKRALMSDGVVLSNSGYGWKKRGKLRSGVTSEKWIKNMELSPMNWERISR